MLSKGKGSSLTVASRATLPEPVTWDSLPPVSGVKQRLSER
ncbi:Uncharacterized protein YR821_3082 [Yersinia ruckeri]|uniref:Uncharacterized protein n=1 Tax=Yersinia ruckeri TaxID=29486 RepID=A0A0A8VH51_YERRU|nr:Uncharacterized protein YR821_3082 [Yersinia ruckeri]CEK28915.1 hypothetical protein CSF007_15965 [Yersinia ruckeri]